MVATSASMSSFVSRAAPFFAVGSPEAWLQKVGKEISIGHLILARERIEDTAAEQALWPDRGPEGG